MKTKDIKIIKGIKSKALDVDDKGIIKVAIVHYGSKDSDGDIIQHTAYDKSISENFDRFRHFKNHDPRMIPGVPQELYKEGDHLIMISKMILDSDVGRNTYAEYKAGAIKEHSHGFNIINQKKDETLKANIITEGRLWEGSSLTHWGANSNTPTQWVKSMNDALSFLEFAEKAINMGEFTDEYLEKLEKQLDCIKGSLKSIKPDIPLNKDLEPIKYSEILMSNLNFLK